MAGDDGYYHSDDDDQDRQRQQQRRSLGQCWASSGCNATPTTTSCVYKGQVRARAGHWNQPPPRWTRPLDTEFLGTELALCKAQRSDDDTVLLIGGCHVRNFVGPGDAAATAAATDDCDGDGDDATLTLSSLCPDGVWPVAAGGAATTRDIEWMIVNDEWSGITQDRRIGNTFEHIIVMSRASGDGSGGSGSCSPSGGRGRP
jgi:hypothetical protein